MQCMIYTNFGIISYQVLPFLPSLPLQIVVTGIANPYNVLPFMNNHIPRGSTFSQSVLLTNPSKTRKIRVFRVVPSGSQLHVHISAPSDLGSVVPRPSRSEWQVDEQDRAAIFAFSFASTTSTYFFVGLRRRDDG